MPIGLWKTATQFTHRANRLYYYKVYDLNNLYFLTRVVHFYSATLVQFYSALDKKSFSEIILCTAKIHLACREMVQKVEAHTTSQIWRGEI